MTDPSTSGRDAALALHPASTLVAWLEAHVRGRRVALLGDATAGLAEAIATRGARLVHAYDPDARRAAEAAATGSRAIAPRPVFAALEGDLGVRDGAFDVVIVPDLGLFGDAAEAVRRVRRLLSPSGIAVIASRNPDASRWLVRAGAVVSASPSYYDLFDLVSLQFPEVKMLGQTPFVGYAIVDFAADEPEVTVDASLLDEAEAPEWYVAVAGDRRLEVDAYALIELPFGDVAQSLAGGEPTTLRRHELEEGQKALEGRQALEARVRELEGETGRLREIAESTSGASRDREQIAARLAEAERELGAAVARMREAEARAADTHVRAERLSTELRELDDELRRQRERGARLNKLLEEEKRGRARPAGPAMQAPQVSFAAPPVPDSAALTMRPAGLPDDARRAAAREATLRHELDRATARIVELERLAQERQLREAQAREEAPPPPTLEPVTTEPATVDRERARLQLVEAEQRMKLLEARLADRDAKLADREAKLADRDARLADRDAKLADRDAKLADRDAKLADLTGRLNDATARLGEGTGRLTDRETRVAQLTAKVAELTTQLAEARRRETDAERRVVVALNQRETIEARLAAAEPELASLRVERDKLDARRSAAERSLVDARGALERAEARQAQIRTEVAAATRATMQAEIDAARALADEAERRARAAAGGGSQARAQEEEVDRLEAALRDRGREVARLQAELREGFRVGKELLEELEAARIIAPRTPGGAGDDGPRPTSNGAGSSALGGGDLGRFELGARVEAASEHAARAEADLVGASLKIAQLEHELRRLRTVRTADDARRALEAALIMAQDEIASLRAGGASTAAEVVVPAAAAAHQQVLLHQLEALRDGAPSSATGLPPSAG